MPRSIWKGSISFGLVQIPVALYPAEEPNEVSFKQLDKRDMTPIRYERVNRETGKPVSWDDIVRGYAYDKDEYVVVSDEDLRRANVEATQTVDILDFVDASEIEPMFYDKPYYLAPASQGKKKSPVTAYVLLREALRRTGKVGIAKVVIRTREHLAAVMPRGKALVMNLLRFAHELRSDEELELPELDAEGKGLGKRELEMAERLVAEMATDWKPEKYKDEYRDDVMKLIEKKVKSGETTTPAEPAGEDEDRGRQTGTVDLIALLKKSLGQKGGKAANDEKEAHDAEPKVRKTDAAKRKTGSRRAA
ncbi:DNA repair protein [Sorangium cellulosum]|uniref:Non-homologous end joining protein Ku n=1 Tax=Sorangium cellulosum TaxID=56 RepID=A0A2L0EQT6_SORCE|nr:Ku protein [Sorangium cellulosum]AUX41630.1 DNA repair protein [Sorangium cellulosum]